MHGCCGQHREVKPQKLMRLPCLEQGFDDGVFTTTAHITCTPINDITMLQPDRLIQQSVKQHMP